jgi:hypothetical protein
MIALQIGGPEAEDQDCPERSRTDDIPSSTCKTVGESRSRPQPDETSVREMDAYVLPFVDEFPCYWIGSPCSLK